MFDFPMTETGVGTSVFLLSFYVLLLLYHYKPGIKNAFRKKNLRSHRIALCIFFIYVVCFCLKGDFFHMMEYVHTYSFVPGAYNYGEPVYIEIGRLVNRNYFLFRCIVWGGAFILFCRTANRFKIPVYEAAVVMVLCYAINFCYARATAAMAVYYFGLSYLCTRKLSANFFPYLIGLICIMLSWQFHNSAIVMIALTPVIFVPFKRWTVLSAIVLLPLLAIVAKGFFFEMMMSDMDMLGEHSDIIQRKMESYSDKSKNFGISSMIMNVFQFGSFYLPVILFTVKLYAHNRYQSIPAVCMRLYKYMLALVLFSSIFYFFGESFIILFYRLLFMSLIPIIILLVKFYEMDIIERKWFLLCVWTGILFHLVRLPYDVYHAIYFPGQGD